MCVWMNGCRCIISGSTRHIRPTANRFANKQTDKKQAQTNYTMHLARHVSTRHVRRVVEQCARFDTLVPTPSTSNVSCGVET